MTRSRATAIGLGALGVLVYVLWLGTRDFWYPGEPDLAEICRAMFVSGDWIVPRRNGEIFLNYGPLSFWAGTVSSHLLYLREKPGAVCCVLSIIAFKVFDNLREGFKFVNQVDKVCTHNKVRSLLIQLFNTLFH